MKMLKPGKYIFSSRKYKLLNCLGVKINHCDMIVPEDIDKNEENLLYANFYDRAINEICDVKSKLLNEVKVK